MRLTVDALSTEVDKPDLPDRVRADMRLALQEISTCWPRQ
jgi:hypothetical protein